jgi:IS30 family transposase
MRTYTQLTQGQRYQIYTLLRIGQYKTEIAEVIGTHKSTISRELSRNRGQRGYRPKPAQQMAMNRRKKAKPRIQEATWALIESKLREDWSPEQISDWVKKNKDNHVSHERIYQYVLADKRAGGDLYKHLRCQKKRRKRYGSYDRRGKLPNRRSIEQRPEIVDQRQRLGDWEVDTILGKGRRQAIVTLTERKSRRWIGCYPRRMHPTGLVMFAG